MEYRLIPIETESQLPQPGTSYETRMFDMKLRYRDDRQFEKAKDVAAFANGTGGIILLGAIENLATGHLLRYEPMSETDALVLRNQFDEAVRDRCRPVPIADARIIQKDAGYVVAVSVWPFPGQVVGVKIRSDPAEGRQHDTWYFPMRSGTHTIELQPEHTAMLMSPKMRAVAVSLSRIPMRVGVSIRLCYQATTHVSASGKRDSTIHAYGELHDYSLLENRVALRVENPNRPQMSEIFLPMDAIQSVWQGKDASEWHMALSGSIVFPTDKKPAFYSYHIGPF